MTIHTHGIRVLHKWIGLVIGLQFLIWAVSGAMMALLDMEAVAGGPRAEPLPVERPLADGWPRVQAQLAGTAVTGVATRPLLGRQIVQVSTPEGARLFDASTGAEMAVDRQVAGRIAAAAFPGPAPIERIEPLRELTLAVREHELPIWRVDFADPANSSYYVSAATGELLERRNDSWRLWDVFWMLHNMDYVNRTSFNHPMIIVIGFAAVWLAVSGVYLLFRTGWRSDFKRLRKKTGRA